MPPQYNRTLIAWQQREQSRRNWRSMRDGAAAIITMLMAFGVLYVALNVGCVAIHGERACYMEDNQ